MSLFFLNNLLALCHNKIQFACHLVWEIEVPIFLLIEMVEILYQLLIDFESSSWRFGIGMKLRLGISHKAGWYCLLASTSNAHHFFYHIISRLDYSF